jgi:hypothetical protein
VTNGGRLLLRRKPPVLSRAVMALKAGVYDPTLDSLLDLTGHGLHMRLGSAVGPDTNDPLRLLLSDGGKRVYCPGSTGNYVSTPDSAALSITGDIDIRVKAALTDWTPAVASGLACKATTTTTRSWLFQVDSTTGKLRLAWSPDGSAASQVSVASTVSPTISDGSALWLRAVLDVDNGAGGKTVRFYTSSDGITWAQLGTDVTSAGTTSIHDNNSAVELGSFFGGTDSLLSGSVFALQIRSGIGGTLVADFDATKLSEPYATHTDPQGNVWTFNRSASGRKLAVVDRDMLLFGTDDYGEVADNALLNFGAADSFTTLLAYRYYDTLDAFDRLIQKAGSTGIGYTLLRYNPVASGNYTYIGDGTSTVTSQPVAISAGRAAMAGMVLSRQTQTIRAFTGATFGSSGNVSAVGSIANTGKLRLFTTATDPVGSFSDGEFFAAAIFREALSQTDLQRLAAELGVSS